jgi:hypothetical protein
MWQPGIATGTPHYIWRDSSQDGEVEVARMLIWQLDDMWRRVGDKLKSLACLLNVALI